MPRCRRSPEEEEAEEGRRVRDSVREGPTAEPPTPRGDRPTGGGAEVGRPEEAPRWGSAEAELLLPTIWRGEWGRRGLLSASWLLA